MLGLGLWLLGFKVGSEVLDDWGPTRIPDLDARPEAGGYVYRYMWKRSIL